MSFFGSWLRFSRALVTPQKQRRKIFEPVNCHLWTSAPNLTSAELHKNFETVEVFEDDSHRMRSLRKCKKCDQLYFFEFYEFVDPVEGRDPQYCTYIPVNNAADIEILKKASSIELNGFAPSLRDDSTKDGSRIYWSGR